jgi:hypothetical protein
VFTALHACISAASEGLVESSATGPVVRTLPCCRRFAYLSQPLLRDSAASISNSWQQKRQGQQQQHKAARLLLSGGHAPTDANRSSSSQDASSGVSSSSSSSWSALNMLLSQLQQGLHRRESSTNSLPDEGGSGGSNAPYKLTQEHVEDDAFGTLMQASALKMVLRLVEAGVVLLTNLNDECRVLAAGHVWVSTWLCCLCVLEASACMMQDTKQPGRVRTAHSAGPDAVLFVVLLLCACVCVPAAVAVCQGPAGPAQAPSHQAPWFVTPRWPASW